MEGEIERRARGRKGGREGVVYSLSNISQARREKLYLLFWLQELGFFFFIVCVLVRSLGVLFVLYIASPFSYLPFAPHRLPPSLSITPQPPFPPPHLLSAFPSPKYVVFLSMVLVIFLLILFCLSFGNVHICCDVCSLRSLCYCVFFFLLCIV